MDKMSVLYLILIIKEKLSENYIKNMIKSQEKYAKNTCKKRYTLL